MDLSTVCPVALFDDFVTASTCQSIIDAFHRMCLALDVPMATAPNQFYNALKSATISNWKAAKLWSLLDARRAQKEYCKGDACRGARLLVIGGGPCGLRSAIECALLGVARVLLVEQRSTFSRNNVLHLWPFVIDDVKALGGKIFYPRFCAGAIDHISIRQLQNTLLKTALCLGVHVVTGVGFDELVLPCTHPSTSESIGWRAEFTPNDHYMGNYEFDAVIAADGKRDSLPGFARREMRGKLAIGITANFVNRRTQAEEGVEEISGVASIFNQQFFGDMFDTTRIDLENIVYYKDDTHYFVMCARKQSLLEKGVLVEDLDDVKALLSHRNVDQSMLQSYAREAADFSTNGALPRLDYSLSVKGEPDVAMFDFTSLFSAEHSARIADRNGRQLLMMIVGDSLHEPFWPTGSGCARGFLGALDACWLLRGYCQARKPVLDLLAERESMFRLLPQTTVTTLMPKCNQYTLDPGSRYKCLESHKVRPDQVRHLIETDNTEDIWEWLLPADQGGSRFADRTKSQFRTQFLDQHTLLTFLQSLLSPYKLGVHNFTTCWADGRALCALIVRANADLLDYGSLDVEDGGGNRRLAFNLIERQFGLTPPTDDADWLDGKDVTNEHMLMNYLRVLVGLIEEQLGERRTVLKTTSMKSKSLKSTRKKRAMTTVVTTADVDGARRGLVDKLRSAHSTVDDDTTLHEMASNLTDAQIHTILDDWADEDRRQSTRARSAEPKPKDDKVIGKLRWRADGTRVLDGKSPSTPVGSTNNGKTTRKPGWISKLDVEKVHIVEQMISGQLVRTQYDELYARKRRDAEARTGRLDEAGMGRMERKLEETASGGVDDKERWEVLKSGDRAIVTASASDARLIVNQGFDRPISDEAAAFDETMSNLHKMEHKQDMFTVTSVAQLKALHSSVSSATKPPRITNIVMPQVRVPEMTPAQPPCYFCKKKVYLAEKITVEAVVLHKRCFRCAYCNTALRVGHAVLDRSLFDSHGNHFYCRAHMFLPPQVKVNRLDKVDVDGGNSKPRTVIGQKPEPPTNERRPSNSQFSSYHTSDATSDGSSASHDEESSEGDDSILREDAQLIWAEKRAAKLEQQRQHLPWVRNKSSISSASDQEIEGTPSPTTSSSDHEATPIPSSNVGQEEKQSCGTSYTPKPTGMLSQLFSTPLLREGRRKVTNITDVKVESTPSSQWQRELDRIHIRLEESTESLNQSERDNLDTQRQLLCKRLERVQLEDGHNTLQREYKDCMSHLDTQADLTKQQGLLQRMINLLTQRDAINQDIDRLILRCS